MKQETIIHSISQDGSGQKATAVCLCTCDATLPKARASHGAGAVVGITARSLCREWAKESNSERGKARQHRMPWHFESNGCEWLER
jgi:hypothetical protein